MSFYHELKALRDAAAEDLRELDPSNIEEFVDVQVLEERFRVYELILMLYRTSQEVEPTFTEAVPTS